MQKLTPMSVFLSIIIPTYNRKTLVQYAIDSALSFGKRLDQGFEVIVVDDCSTDDTNSVLMERYAKEIIKGPVRFFQTPQNLGVTAARNLGSEPAKGKWLLFLDSDDLLIPDAAKDMSHLLAQFAHWPIMMFRCLDLESGHLIGRAMPLSYELTVREFLNKGTPGECLPVIRQDIFRRFPYDSTLHGCEGLAYARILKAVGPGMVTTLVARKYRRSNTDRLSSLSGRMRRACSIAHYHRLVLVNHLGALCFITVVGTVMKLMYYWSLCIFRLFGERKR